MVLLLLLTTEMDALQYLLGIPVVGGRVRHKKRKGSIFLPSFGRAQVVWTHSPQALKSTNDHLDGELLAAKVEKLSLHLI